MASGKEIRISITSALNAAGIEATKQQVDAMGKSLKKSMADAASGNRKHWADIKAAWDMGCAAIRKAWQAASAGLREAFKFATQTDQLKTLIGDIDATRAHMADLKALGDTPPFSLDEFAKASRSLMVMTDGALGYKNSLELIGDAAAATGYPVEELGHAVGRLYAFIRDGQPISRAVMQLHNMGVITPEVAKKLQDLQAAGKSNAEVWAEVEAQLGRYNGAMAETEKTGEGLMGAIKSRWDNIVRAFGMAWADEAKGGMQTVLDKMKEIEEDGTLAVWAAKVGEAIHDAVKAVKALHDELNKVGDSEPIDMFDRSRSGGQNIDHSIGQFFGNIWAQLGAIGAAARGLFVPGENAFNNYLAYGALHGHGGWSDAAARKLNERMRASGEWTEDTDIRSVNEQHYAEIKADAEKKITEKRREEERTAAEREVAEKKRIDDNLAAAQKKQDEKKAAETAEKEAKAKEEAAKKAAAVQERLDREAAARRERQAEKERNDKIKNHQTLLQAENQSAADARSAKSAAESKLQQAWGWYRDKDSMRAQLEEEKADKAARKQYEKDFEKLKSRSRDWRTAENLSVDDEAVRRVALAKEEKEAANRHLAEIEKNTADLAAKLDELLAVKG